MKPVNSSLTADAEAGNPNPNTTPHSGRRWTIVAGLLVFGSILLSVWFYLVPRLSGQPVSPTASVELRLASEQTVEAWTELTTLSGAVVYLQPDVVLTAKDLSTFHGHYQPDGQPLLDLQLTTESAARLGHLLADNQPAATHLALIVNHRLLGAAPAERLVDGRLIIPLNGVNRADAEEAFARLTE